jgi:hypothetical protein
VVFLKTFIQKLGNSIKKILLKLRNIVFSSLEILCLRLLLRVNLQKKMEKTIIVCNLRPGRGLKQSHVDSEWFTSVPHDIKKCFRFFKYNNRIWIWDSFKALYLMKRSTKITFVLLSYAPTHHKFPSLALLSFLQKNDAKIVKVWLDSWSEQLWDLRIKPMAQLGSYNILFDKLNDLSKSKDPYGSYIQKLPAHTPVEFIEFKKRKHLLFYSGSIGSEGVYRSRGEYLDFLKSNNVDVVGHAAQHNQKKFPRRPSYEQYRRELSNSKIGLNFTWKNNTHIITYRTWDILSSGVLLLQNKSTVFGDLLEEGKHYLSFESRENLLQIISEILEHRYNIEEIALNGMVRYKELMSDNNFWRDVYNS